MANPTPWPEEDAKEAYRLHEECGLSWTQVGAVFGKSKSATQAAVWRYLGRTAGSRDMPLLGPPIGFEQSEAVTRKRDKAASADLCAAINALIDRMPANDVAEMLGKPHLKIPGTERIHKTSQIERLAA